MIDVSIIKSNNCLYSVKSMIKEIDKGKYLFKIIFIYEIESPSYNTYIKKKTIYDENESDEKKFNHNAYKELFKDITSFIGKKYYATSLVV